MNAPLPTSFMCWGCSKPIEGERVEKFTRGQPCFFHHPCWEKVEIDQQRAADRQLLAAQTAIQRSFDYSANQPALTQSVGGLAVFPFADLDNEEFRRRTSKKILAAVERYKFDVSLLISSATGRGKTSGIVARLNKLKDDAIAAAKPADSGSFPRGFSFRFFFLAGYELATARRNWKLGEESPIIQLAKDIEVLILDEVGFEQLTELPFEVIDHRYRNQRVTVVTTGLKPAEFRARYGDAAFRRIAEGGAVIEDW